MNKVDWENVDYLIDLRGVHDGWSIAVMNDGTMINRWANREGDGPAEDTPNIRRKYEATEEAIKKQRVARTIEYYASEGEQ